MEVAALMREGSWVLRNSSRRSALAQRRMEIDESRAVRSLLRLQAKSKAAAEAKGRKN
jgi:hypothetical protein